VADDDGRRALRLRHHAREGGADRGRNFVAQLVGHEPADVIRLAEVGEPWCCHKGRAYRCESRPGRTVRTGRSPALGARRAGTGGAAAARTTGNQPSNDIRSFSVRRALEVAEQSPILGYGGTRAQQGSNSTIAVGKSPTCPNCGNLPIGTNGQLWFSLVGQGFVGAFAYLMFHVAALVRLLRGRSVVPVAAGVSMLLAIWFEFVYDRVVSTSCIEFLVLAVGLRAMLPDRAGRPVATATTAVPR